MHELSVRFRYMLRDEIPPRSRLICPPPKYVMVLTASATPRAIETIESRANYLTNKTPSVNDLFQDYLTATAVERVTHALEHIVISTFLLNGTLKPAKLMGQTLGVILPGNEHDGTDNTSVWIRDGLIEPNFFFSSILMEIIDFGGHYSPLS